MQRQRITAMYAYYLLLAGSFVSGLGSYMTTFGLSVWVYQETRSATAFGALIFFMIIPMAVGGLIAGPYVDRWNRRRVMMGSDLIASLATLVLLLLYSAGALQQWHLYITFAGSGVANAFLGPAFGASIPLLVPAERLGRAAGMGQMLSALVPILGAPLAGFLVATVGLGLIFTIDFATFAFSLLVLTLVVIPQPRPPAAEQRQHFLADLRFGLHYLWLRKPLVYLMGLMTLFAFLNDILATLFGPLVMSFADAQAFGFVYAAFGAGALVSGGLLGLWGGPKRRMTGILWGAGVAGVGALVAGTWANVPVIMVGLFCYGVGSLLAASLHQVIYQSTVASTVLGRVFALNSVVQLTTSAVGVLLAGPLATHIVEPLLLEGGALAPSIGAVIGIGPGRGIGLIYIGVGVTMLVVTAFAALSPRLCRLEDHLVEADPAVSMVEAALVDAVVP